MVIMNKLLRHNWNDDTSCVSFTLCTQQQKRFYHKITVTAMKLHGVQIWWEKLAVCWTWTASSSSMRGKKTGGMNVGILTVFNGYQWQRANERGRRWISLEKCEKITINYASSTTQNKWNIKKSQYSNYKGIDYQMLII